MNGKGFVLYQLGRFDDALECLKKSLKLNPNFLESWEIKGNVLNELERYEEALDCYEKVLNLNPNDKNGCYNKTYSKKNKDKFRDFKMF